MAQIFLNWAQIFDPFAFPTMQSDTQLVINNTDGRTRTVFTGTGFTYDLSGFPTGGAINSISLILNDGDVVLQTLSNVDPTALADIGSFASQAFALRTQISWSFLINQDAEPTVFTPTEIRLRNTDNTFTVVTGSGFAIAGENLSGTVTAIQLFDTDGITPLDSVPATEFPVSLALGASALFDEVRSTQAYLIANQGNNTLTSNVESAVSGPDTIFVNLVDGPGSDTIDAGDAPLNPPLMSWGLSSAAITLDLGAGTVTSAAGNDSIIGLPAGGNVGGSDFNDVMTGNNFANFIGGGDGDDTLDGAGGNDTLFGGPGNDSLIGGAGIDTADYQDFDATTGVTVNLSIATAQNTIGAGVDTLNTIENLRGGNFGDTLTGNNLNNLLQGIGGNDTLIGGLGNDTLIGGNGFDVFIGGGGNDTFNGGDPNLGNSESVPYERLSGGLANYAATGTGPIAVVFSTTQTVTGGAGIDTDTLTSVQQVRGTIAGDTFTVDSNYVGLFLNGFAEFEGMGGNDIITGNGVNTRISFSQATAGVSVDLLSGSAIGTEIGTDTFTGVTQVRGSSGADTITGAGMSGDLSFIGQGGNDTITGSGLSINNFDSNTADYSNAAIGESISVVASANTIVTGGASLGTDTLIAVPHIRGTNANDTYTVNGSYTGAYGLFNEFEGMAGNDTIIGNGSTRIAFSRAIAGVTVDLALGTAFSFNNAADIGIDTFTGVNGVRGSNYGDTFIGSNGAQAERFRGSQGADTIDGGGGSQDMADYGRDITGVSVNLATNLATDGWDDTDVLSGIEGVFGSEFNDILLGNDAGNILIGQHSADSLSGAGGDDFLVGDDLNTALLPFGSIFGTSTQFDSGNDTLIGGLGNDTLDGGAGADSLNGGGGDDTLRTDGSDTIFGDTGVDTVIVTNAAGVNLSVGIATRVEIVRGNAGNDTIDATGAANAVSLFGGAGNDTLTAAGGSDQLFGQDGNDVLVGAAANDTMNGGAGADSFDGAAGNDQFLIDQADTTFNGGAGFDIIQVVSAAGVNISIGSSQIEKAVGGTGADAINATGAVATVALYGVDGNDSLTGGDAADVLLGGGGNDHLIGGGGNNFMDGGAGTDTYTGGSGSESFFLDATDTLIDAGAGIDRAYVVDAAGVNLALGSTNLEYAFGFTGNDVIDMSGATQAVFLLSGNNGNDSLIGGSGNDLFINGGSGNDTLDGGTGADQIQGGAGNDRIIGGSGNDVMFGGTEADTFVFSSAGTGLDKIFDWQDGSDLVDFSAHAGVNGLGDLTISLVNGNTRIASGADTIVLVGFAGTIDGNDFLF